MNTHTHRAMTAQFPLKVGIPQPHHHTVTTTAPHAMNFVPPWAGLGDGGAATDSTSTSSPGPELVRGHRRSRSDPGRTGEDDEARLAEQRYRNRLSARMHRRRASEHLARLRQDVLCKEHEHAALASRVASLEDCNRALRTRVHETWAQLSSLLACLPQPLPQCQPQEPPPQQEQQQNVCRPLQNWSAAATLHCHTRLCSLHSETAATTATKAIQTPAQTQRQRWKCQCPTC